MREISLTKGYTAIVDDDDYDDVSRHKWCAIVTGQHIKRVYAMRRETIDGRSVYILLHRQIMKAPSELDVDHKNHDTLDCRKDNMRLATRSQNLANNRRSIGVSGYRGVTKAHNSNGWMVIFRSKYYGTFNDKITAAKQYDFIAKKVFGEFAVLNFPEGECGATAQ